MAQAVAVAPDAGVAEVVVSGGPGLVADRIHSRSVSAHKGPARNLDLLATDPEPRPVALVAAGPAVEPGLAALEGAGPAAQAGCLAGSRSIVRRDWAELWFFPCVWKRQRDRRYPTSAALPNSVELKLQIRPIARELQTDC